MRFIETVTGKLLDQIKNLDRQYGIDALRGRALFKDAALLGHLLRLFLAHRSPQQICATEGVTRQHLSDLHDLFLIKDDSVGWLKNRLQPLMLVLCIGVCEGLATMLAVNKVFDHARLQGSRSKQRHQSNNVLKTIRAQIFDQLLHPATFQLEDRSRIARLHEPENVGVIQRNRVNIQRGGGSGIDHLSGPLDNGQRTQPQKVELHQARFLNIVFVVLSNDTGAIFVTINWRKISQGTRSDHHSPRVLTCISCDALQLHRHVPDFLRGAVFLEKGDQLFFLLQRFGERHAHLKRNEFRHSVR